MKKYSIDKISKDLFDRTPLTVRLYQVDSVESNTQYFAINECFYFSNYGDIDETFAPFFIEINDILFVAFYDRVYGLSLKEGKIRYATDLEFALIGVEKYDEQIYIITDGSITRVLCSNNPELCYTFHYSRTLNESGFITDYKRINNQVLKLIHEDGSITEYNLHNSSYIYPSVL